jgi:hypothetical protein
MPAMETTLDDRYVVFVREEPVPGRRMLLPVERELVTCASYKEARWVQRECSTPKRKCIIRFVGPAGGGD